MMPPTLVRDVPSAPLRVHPSQCAAKSVLERTAAAAGLLVLSPFLAVVGIIVRCDSPGRALYWQERIGHCGRPFRMCKFRTMTQDAEVHLAEVLTAQGMTLGPLYKLKADPRVTRVGAFLRRYSIDELPQLWNVVRGEMSLVGPRPQVAAEVNTYTDEVRRRLSVKPGMTGLWQVNGRSDLCWDEAVRLDLQYVENWSLLLDLNILWHTPRAVRRSAGAY